MKLLGLLVLASCGRLDFGALPPADAAVDGASVASCPGMPEVFDEDGDLVGDPCDVCPHRSDPDQADGDGDGVGDVCDPDLALARQRIAFFDGFNSVRPEWATPGVVQNGKLVFDAAGAGAFTTLSIALSTSRLQLGGTIATVWPPSGPAPNHLLVATNLTPTEAYYVELIDVGAGRRRSLMHELDTVYTELDGRQETVPVEPGPIEIMLSVGTDQAGAYFTTAGAQDQLFTSSGTGPISGTECVMYIRSLDVAFDYAVSIETF